MVAPDIRKKKDLGLFPRDGLRAQVLRGSVYSVVLKLFFTAASLGTTIILARVLGPEGYGVYAYALALITMISIPTQFGLPTLLIRNVAAYHVKEQWGLMRGLLYRANQWVILISIILMFVAAVVILARADLFISEHLATFTWALVLLPLIALGNLRGAALRGLRRVVEGQLPEQLLRPGLLLIFLLVALVFLDEVFIITPSRAMALNALAAFIAFVVGTWLLFKGFPVQARTAVPEYETRAWMRSVLPLSFLAGMQVVNQQTGILVLGLFATVEDVGIYRVALQGATLVAFSLNAVNMVLGPYISRLYATGEHERLQYIVTYSARAILFLTLPVVAVFILFGSYILETVFGPEYSEGYMALVILCLGQLVNAGMGSVVLLLNMTGYERDTAMGFAIAAIVAVVLSIILIPFYGIEGAAAATAVSLMVWNVLLFRRAYQRLGIISIAVVPSRWKRAN